MELEWFMLVIMVFLWVEVGNVNVEIVCVREEGEVVLVEKELDIEMEMSWMKIEWGVVVVEEKWLKEESFVLSKVLMKVC